MSTTVRQKHLHLFKKFFIDLFSARAGLHIKQNLSSNSIQEEQNSA
ncbi:hypothetical protein HX005_02660 [Acinetobacter sp. R933-2]|nr:hypothetical protein [Acinetobacter sp. R933-2]MDM1246296.1 hypothetical protein [Acinetobacter sp. R933-2]